MDTKEMIRELLQQIYDGLNNFETAAKETVKKLAKVNNPMIDEEIITDIEETVDELLELCEEEYIPFEVMAKEIKNRLHQEINHLKTMIENERKMRNVSDNEKNNKCNKCFLEAMPHDMRDRIYSIEIDNERNVSIYFESYYEDEGGNERKMRNVSDNEKNNKCNKCFLEAMPHDMRDRIYSIEIDNERNVSIYFESYYEDEGGNE